MARWSDAEREGTCQLEQVARTCVQLSVIADTGITRWSISPVMASTLNNIAPESGPALLGSNCKPTAFTAVLRCLHG